MNNWYSTFLFAFQFLHLSCYVWENTTLIFHTRSWFCWQDLKRVHIAQKLMPSAEWFICYNSCVCKLGNISVFLVAPHLSVCDLGRACVLLHSDFLWKYTVHLCCWSEKEQDDLTLPSVTTIDLYKGTEISLRNGPPGCILTPDLFHFIDICMIYQQEKCKREQLCCLSQEILWECHTLLLPHSHFRPSGGHVSNQAAITDMTFMILASTITKAWRVTSSESFNYTFLLRVEHSWTPNCKKKRIYLDTPHPTKK